MPFVDDGRSCPSCDGEAIPIAYGFPTHQTMVAAEAGEVFLAGCEVSLENPDLFCTQCASEFYENDHDAGFFRSSYYDPEPIMVSGYVGPLSSRLGQLFAEFAGKPGITLVAVEEELTTVLPRGVRPRQWWEKIRRIEVRESASEVEYALDVDPSLIPVEFWFLSNSMGWQRESRLQLGDFARVALHLRSTRDPIGILGLLDGGEPRFEGLSGRRPDPDLFFWAHDVLPKKGDQT
jgi:hypothetical protein